MAGSLSRPCACPIGSRAGAASALDARGRGGSLAGLARRPRWHSADDCSVDSRRRSALRGYRCQSLRLMARGVGGACAPFAAPTRTAGNGLEPVGDPGAPVCLGRGPRQPRSHALGVGRVGCAAFCLLHCEGVWFVGGRLARCGARCQVSQSGVVSAWWILGSAKRHTCGVFARGGMVRRSGGGRRERVWRWILAVRVEPRFSVEDAPKATGAAPAPFRSIEPFPRQHFSPGRPLRRQTRGQNGRCRPRLCRCRTTGGSSILTKICQSVTLAPDPLIRGSPLIPPRTRM